MNFRSISEEETEVNVTIAYTHLGGVIGEVFLEMFDNPESKLEKGLNHFKKYVEEDGIVLNDSA